MNKFLPMADPPKSVLGRLRLLSPTAGVKVSPLCLGAMNFGGQMNDFLGECDQKTAEEIMDYFYDQGGNFIDTASNYQYGWSEKWVGEWMEKRGNRDEIVLATKYTTNYMAGPGHPYQMGNFAGNGSKSLHLSVEASLKKLKTTYIDLLWLHWWDYSTSIPELMQSLNHLVASGKVLYLGISDSPAWVVSKANEYARAHGLRPFSVYQGKWSAATRDMERDIIPMCKAEGMGICPWGALGGGSFKSEEQRKAGDGRARGPTAKEVEVTKVLEKIAKRKNTIITSIALAYIMHKTAYVFPIVGGRKLDHLKSNIEALSLELTTDNIKEIEGAIPFDLGFPHDFLWPNGVPSAPQEVNLAGMAAQHDWVSDPQPITPKKNEQ